MTARRTMRPDLPVVIYHSINDRPGAHPLGSTSFTTREFRAHLREFRRRGREMIGCSELLERARTGWLRDPLPVVLTFDDGFLDTALVAADILEEHGAKGTLFVNPGHAAAGSPRTRADVPDAWGMLNYGEMRALRARGVLEVDSHTLTHEYVFLSPRLVDLYEPAKFDRYYWLAWMLHPETLTDWDGDVRRHASRIPAGYPVFEHGRALEGRRFVPAPSFVARCLELFADRGRDAFGVLASGPSPGLLESAAEYERRIERQVVSARERLAKEIPGSGRFIAFPGEVAPRRALELAADLGYELYMKREWDGSGRNLDALAAAAGRPGGALRGLRRVCLTYRYRGWLPQAWGARWAARLQTDGFGGAPLARRLVAAGRRTGFRRAEPRVPSAGR